MPWHKVQLADCCDDRRHTRRESEREEKEENEKREREVVDIDSGR